MVSGLSDGVEAPAVCHGCQRPTPDRRYSDGEWYHVDCRPDTMKG